ncbi:anhydro-N-acetylmuramic acid kinase [Umboniibacter marinipuniceus]|uniref:Anhydro-N-acetylmuramic acid kinase n=1 Tax=Umboniibacter marinipuniceus TaxID=569599 RepID=A0A3M0AGQ9_9GAMM|nr:anhydro-N-acetylmuramic acid kinase [Umboniibacter marinipuniceus]RMA82749.1 anhydro-N-acetylmuramic acid kinase [Umboniibacter marinipuniceus]
MKRFIGLMSGTSLDGLDVVCATFETPSKWAIEFAQTYSFPAPLAKQLSALASEQDNHLESMATAAIHWSEFAAECIQQLIAEQQLSAAEITAIGSHGQTIRHRPNASTPFSLQIGCPSTLAHHTGITVVADFRSKDIAAGGQGAPLVPAFHGELFQGNSWLTLNLGGIANIAFRDEHHRLVGYDTGPANILINHLCQKYFDSEFDRNGDIAQRGEVHSGSLRVLLEDPYFKRPAPKSTGPEYFNLDWLGQHGVALSPEDAVATATELTVQSIASALSVLPQIQDIWVFGGGVKNDSVIQGLKHALTKTNSSAVIRNTGQIGIDPDFMEALVFAWLAQRCLASLPGNCSSVTGAQDNVILGGIYPAG